MGKDGRFIKDFSYTYGHTYYWNDVQLKEVGQELKVSACYPTVAAPNPAAFSWDVTDTSAATADFWQPLLPRCKKESPSKCRYSSLI